MLHPSVFKQRCLSRSRFRRYADVPVEMQIAPPGYLRAGGANSIRAVEEAFTSRGGLLPRATCSLALVVVHADLLSIRLDPQSAGGDTTRVETRDRAPARPAETGRAEISKWEIDGRFHTIPVSEAIYMVHVESAALARATPRDDLPDPAIPPRVTYKTKVAPRCSHSPGGVRSRWHIRAARGVP